MNDAERSAAKKLARILRAARAHSGFTQNHIADYLEMAQGTYSKIEKEKIIISAPHWFLFCRKNMIGVDAYEKGFVDWRMEQLGIFNQVNEHKIPTRYFKGSVFTVRFIRPIILWFIEQMGEDKAFEFLNKELDIPDTFWIDLTAPLNISLVEVLVALQRQVAGSDIRPVMMRKYFAYPQAHGVTAPQRTLIIDRVKHIKDLVRSFDQYQKLHAWQAHGQDPHKLELVTTLAERETRQTQILPTMREYLSLYWKEMLVGMITLSIGENAADVACADLEQGRYMVNFVNGQHAYISDASL